MFLTLQIITEFIKIKTSSSLILSSINSILSNDVAFPRIIFFFKRGTVLIDENNKNANEAFRKLKLHLFFPISLSLLRISTVRYVDEIYVIYGKIFIVDFIKTLYRYIAGLA